MNLIELFEAAPPQIWDLEEAEFNVNLMAKLYLNRGFVQVKTEAHDDYFLVLLESPLFTPFPEVKKMSDIEVGHHGIFKAQIQLSSFLTSDRPIQQKYMVQTIFLTQYGSMYNHIPPKNVRTKFPTFRNESPAKVVAKIKGQLVNYEKVIKDSYPEIQP